MGFSFLDGAVSVPLTLTVPASVRFHRFSPNQRRTVPRDITVRWQSIVDSFTVFAPRIWPREGSCASRHGAG